MSMPMPISLAMRARRPFPAPRASAPVVLLGLALVLAGCGGDVATGNIPVPPMADPDAYWAAELNYHALNLTTSGPTSTVQLAVTPRSVTGAALTAVAAQPVYRVADPTALSITADGQLTARKAIYDRTMVIARLTVGSVTRADTAYVRVFDIGPSVPPAALSIQPVPPDSAKWSASFFRKPLIPAVTTAEGTPFEGVFSSALLVDVRSSNDLVASFDKLGLLSGHKPGRALVTASAYAFGVALRDTVTYTIGLPTAMLVGIGEHPPVTGTGPVTYFSPDTITIGVGGLVAWSNNGEGATKTVSVVFDDTTTALAAPPPFSFFVHDAGAGNTGPIPPQTNLGAIRLFTTPGTYRYHDATNQATGVIRVVADTP